MIRHVVLVRFRAEVGPEARDALRRDLEALEVGAPGGAAAYQGFAWGPNASPEGLGQGFDTGFTIDFRDRAARDAYLADPGHAAVGARLVAAAEGGLGGLIVFDLDVG